MKMLWNCWGFVFDRFTIFQLCFAISIISVHKYRNYSLQSYTLYHRHWQSKDEWKGLKSIGVTISTRELKGKKTEQKRYHLCSIKPDALKYAEAVRGHWAIENSLHWILDVVFREDFQRNRKDNSPENMAVIRHTVLNLMKNDPVIKALKAKKLSLKRMKKMLEWDHHYAMSLLFGDIIEP